MSHRLSLLEATVAMSRRRPSLLSYHCSDGSVVRNHSDLRFIAIVHVHSSAILVATCCFFFLEKQEHNLKNDNMQKFYDDASKVYIIFRYNGNATR
jgi:hypothetical protein